MSWGSAFWQMIMKSENKGVMRVKMKVKMSENENEVKMKVKMSENR